MSKELISLEVSKQLKDFVLELVKNGLDRMFINGSFAIIENALKRLEDCENQIEMDNNLIKILQKEINNSEKKIKALEIIKDFNVDVRLLERCESLEEYNKCQIQTGIDDLPQEEYDLLKEVLL